MESLQHPAAEWDERSLESEVAALYTQHGAALLRYAASITGNVDGAHDALQEAFLRYFVERRYGRMIGNPRAWLHQVLRNYLLDRLDTAAAKREVPADGIEELSDCDQDPEALLSRTQMAREITAGLTNREMGCLQLRVEGLSYNEIASVMGVRSGTVGALLNRVTHKFRRAARSRGNSAMDTVAAVKSVFQGLPSYSGLNR